MDSRKSGSAAESGATTATSLATNITNTSIPEKNALKNKKTNKNSSGKKKSQ